MKAAVVVRRANWNREWQLIRRVRTAVFVREQHVALRLEYDGKDPGALHVLAVARSGRAVGTARMLCNGHIGRLAVLRSWRWRGIGTRIMKLLFRAARRRGLHMVDVNAQLAAMPFYTRLGFKPVGRVYVEAGIRHRHMTLGLSPATPRRGHATK